MTKLHLIVAHDLNNVIGDSKTNSMPWKLPPDLVRFKKLTLGYPIIMGKTTFLSLPGGKPLPGRPNIVLTSDSKLQSRNDIFGISNMFDAVSYIKASKYSDAFIIGGAQIYQYALENLNIQTVYRTIIEDTFAGDVHFPQLNVSEFQCYSTETFDYNGLKFRFETLTRL